MTRTRVRRARKRRPCASLGYGCAGTGYVEPGERYAEHVASPNHDGLGNTGWWRLLECWACCERVSEARAVAGL